MDVMEELLRYTLHLIVLRRPIVNQKLKCMNTWQIFHMIQTLFSYNVISFQPVLVWCLPYMIVEMLSLVGVLVISQL